MVETFLGFRQLWKDFFQGLSNSTSNRVKVKKENDRSMDPTYEKHIYYLT